MSDVLRGAISITWKRNRDYALRLVGDLIDSMIIAQPIDGKRINHPAWILSHLSLYDPVCTAMLRGQAFADPADARYGPKSEVSDDPAEYPCHADLIATFLRLHDETQLALDTAAEAVFAAPTPLERWRGQHPQVGHMLVTLMVKHESFHLGQLSAWRRAMGLARVAM